MANPCLEGNGGCDVNATCAIAASGQRTCTCNPGYGGDGLFCVTVAAGEWMRPYVAPLADVEIRGSALDASENLFVHGVLRGDTVDLGCGAVHAGPAGATFVAKLRPQDGACTWMKTFEGTELTDAADLVLDASGDLLVAGRFKGRLDLGCGPQLATLAAAFVASLSSADGLCRWSILGQSDTGFGALPRLGLDKDGRPALYADVSSADFGCGHISGSGPYVASLDPATGTCRWQMLGWQDGPCSLGEGCVYNPPSIRFLGLGPSPSGLSLALTVAGDLGTTLALNGCAFPFQWPAPMERAAILRLGGANGTCLSSSEFPAEVRAGTAQISSSGEVLLAGSLGNASHATASFGCATFDLSQPRTDFVALLDSTGACLHQRAYPTSPYEGLTPSLYSGIASITRDPSSGDLLWLNDERDGAIDYGCGLIRVLSQTSFLVRASADGTCRSVDILGNDQPLVGPSVHLGSGGWAYVTASWRGSMAAGGFAARGALGGSGALSAGVAARMTPNPQARPPRFLTISASGSGFLYYLLRGGTYPCTPPCTTDVCEGEQLVVAATADATSRFVGWSGLCGGPDRRCVIASYPPPRTVTAHFAPLTGTLGASERWASRVTPAATAAVATPTADLRAAESDFSGNVIVAIDFQGAIDLGNGCNATWNGATGMRSQALLLAKLRASDGACQWSHVLNFSNAPAGSGGAQPAAFELGRLAVTAAGDVVVASRLRAITDLGGNGSCSTVGSPLVTSGDPTRFDLFLFSLAGGDGSCRWSRVASSTPFDARFYSTGFAPEEAQNLSLGDDGSLYLWSSAGLLNSNTNLGCGTFGPVPGSAGYAARLSAGTGACAWMRPIATASSSSAVLPTSVQTATASGASLALFGDVRRAVDFGCGLRTASDATYLARFDAATGTCLGDRLLPSSSGLDLVASGSDATGRMTFAGRQSAPIDLGCGAVVPGVLGSPVLARFDSSGACLSHEVFEPAPAAAGVLGSARFDRLAVDRSSGAFALVGRDLAGTVDLGCGPLAASASGVDYLVARFAADGTCQRAHVQNITGSGVDAVLGLGLDGSGDLTIGSVFDGTVTPFPGAPTLTHPGAPATKSLFIGQLGQ